MKQAGPEISRFGALVGRSPEMIKIFEMVDRAAEVNVPVLIVGETGTGKELVAREIHTRSARRNGPFIAVNTGALSAELVASELFGHVKGAFTGAADAHEGSFSEASGGSLFLDEIATTTERIQIVFLRVLEDGVFRPVGAKQDRKVDVRLIAATNADLRNAVEAGQFREDLLQRLTVFRIILPPLREHLEDLPMLAYHFLSLVAKDLNLGVTEVSEEALQSLAQYSWPGNVRELKNAIAQAAIMARHGAILPEHIPPRITSFVGIAPKVAAEGISDDVTQTLRISVADDPNAVQTTAAASRRAQDSLVSPVGLRLEEVQKAYVLKTLAVCSNNKTQAAQMLGVSRKTLRDWLVRWERTDRES